MEILKKSSNDKGAVNILGMFTDSPKINVETLMKSIGVVKCLRF